MSEVQRLFVQGKPQEDEKQPVRKSSLVTVKNPLRKTSFVSFDDNKTTIRTPEDVDNMDNNEDAREDDKHKHSDEGNKVQAVTTAL